MNPFEMVVLIVAVVMIARVVIAKQQARGAGEGFAADTDVQRMREELVALKDRVAVLERLATDDTAKLEREIEKLRG